MSDELLTAAEAAKLSESNPVDEAVKAICEEIRKIAADYTKIPAARRKYTYGGHGFRDTKYTYGNEPLGKVEQGIWDRLVSMGYSLKLQTVEAQFVDQYLEITW